MTLSSAFAEAADSCRSFIIEEEEEREANSPDWSMEEGGGEEVLPQYRCPSTRSAACDMSRSACLSRTPLRGPGVERRGGRRAGEGIDFGAVGSSFGGATASQKGSETRRWSGQRPEVCRWGRSAARKHGRERSWKSRIMDRKWLQCQRW